MLYCNKKLFVFGLFTFLLCSFILPFYVQAIEMGTPWGTDTVPSEVQTEDNEIGFRGESVWDFIESMVTRVANYLLFFGFIVAPLVILIGVFMIFTAGGNPIKVLGAKKLIFWTVAILGIILLARIAISAIRYVVSFN